MRRLLMGVGLAATALLGACDDTGSGFVTGDEAVLCPGGRNCPADSDYVGMLITSSAVEVTRGDTAAFTSAAAPSTATAGASGPAGAQSPATKKAKVCPKRGSAECPPNESGLLWATPRGGAQITCVPESVCLKKDGQPIDASDGDGGTRPMEPGYYGWLCRKSSGDCGDLPQRRR